MQTNPKPSQIFLLVLSFPVKAVLHVMYHKSASLHGVTSTPYMSSTFSQFENAESFEAFSASCWCA